MRLKCLLLLVLYFAALITQARGAAMGQMNRRNYRSQSPALSDPFDGLPFGSRDKRRASISDKTDDVRSLSHPSKEDFGNRLILESGNQLQDRNFGPDILSLEKEIESRLPQDPKFGWAGYFPPELLAEAGSQESQYGEPLFEEDTHNIHQRHARPYHGPPGGHGGAGGFPNIFTESHHSPSGGSFHPEERGYSGQFQGGHPGHGNERSYDGRPQGGNYGPHGGNVGPLSGHNGPSGGYNSPPFSGGYQKPGPFHQGSPPQGLGIDFASPSFDDHNDHSVGGGGEGDLLFPETDFDGFHRDDESHAPFSSGPGNGLEKGSQDRNSGHQILPKGYEEGLYSEPHDYSSQQSSYRDPKSIGGGYGHSPYKESVGGDRSYEDKYKPSGGADIKERRSNLLKILGIGSDSESKRLGYDPDGFGKAASKLKDSSSGYESQNPYQLTQQDYSYYERLAEEGVMSSLVDGSNGKANSYGIEDVNGIEVAAEASIEDQINNDPRYNNNGFDDEGVYGAGKVLGSYDSKYTHKSSYGQDPSPYNGPDSYNGPSSYNSKPYSPPQYGSGGPGGENNIPYSNVESGKGNHEQGHDEFENGFLADSDDTYPSKGLLFEDFHDNNEGLQNDAGFGDFEHQGESGPGFDPLGAGGPNNGEYGHGAPGNYDDNGHGGPNSYGHSSPSPYGDSSHDGPSPYNDGGHGNYEDSGPNDHGSYGDSNRNGHDGYDPLVHQESSGPGNHHQYEDINQYSSDHHQEEISPYNQHGAHHTQHTPQDIFATGNKHGGSFVPDNIGPNQLTAHDDVNGNQHGHDDDFHRMFQHHDIGTGFSIGSFTDDESGGEFLAFTDQQHPLGPSGLSGDGQYSASQSHPVQDFISGGKNGGGSNGLFEGGNPQPKSEDIFRSPSSGPGAGERSFDNIDNNGPPGDIDVLSQYNYDIDYRKYSTAHYDYDYTEDEGDDTANNNPGVNDVNNPATYNFSNPSALSEFSNPANNDFPDQPEIDYGGFKPIIPGQ